VSRADFVASSVEAAAVVLAFDLERPRPEDLDARLGIAAEEGFALACSAASIFSTPAGSFSPPTVSPASWLVVSLIVAVDCLSPAAFSGLRRRRPPRLPRRELRFTSPSASPPDTFLFSSAVAGLAAVPASFPLGFFAVAPFAVVLRFPRRPRLWRLSAWFASPDVPVGACREPLR
jgi:hypothetical protein